MKITRPTRESYRIDLTVSEFTALNSLVRVLRTGFCNWLAGKGKRVQQLHTVYLPESAGILSAFDAAYDLDVTPETAKHDVDYKGQLIARIGALCGTLAEGNNTREQADVCKAAALALLAFAHDSAILSGEECEKWADAISAAKAYANARAAINA
jgi:hypothetical protein